MTDPKVMSGEERAILIKRLEEVDPDAKYSRTLEEESIDAYDITANRPKVFTDLRYAKQLEKRLMAGT
jgi:hypothetical protein